MYVSNYKLHAKKGKTSFKTVMKRLNWLAQMPFLPIKYLGISIFGGVGGDAPEHLIMRNSHVSQIVCLCYMHAYYLFRDINKLFVT